MSEHRTPGNLGGAGWAVCAVGLFALIFISGKLTGNSASALQIVWLRYVGGLVTVILLLLISGRDRPSLRTSQAPVHALRAAAGGLGGGGAVYAAAHMPVAAASAIGLMDGLFTVMLGVFVLGERVSARQWAAAAVCLAGAATVLAGKGAFEQLGAGYLLPSLAALGGAAAIAVESVLIKRLARSERNLPVLFYVNLFGTLLMATPGLATWQPAPLSHLALFLILGPLAIIGQACNLEAFRRTDASIIAPIRYLWVVFALVFGWFFFAEPVSGIALIGVGLILAGGTALAMLRAG